MLKAWKEDLVGQLGQAWTEEAGEREKRADAWALLARVEAAAPARSEASHGGGNGSKSANEGAASR